MSSFIKTTKTSLTPLVSFQIITLLTVCLKIGKLQRASVGLHILKLKEFNRHFKNGLEIVDFNLY